MNLGKRLKLARERRGYTQDYLAELATTEGMPISQALISALERRDSETSTALFQLARALKVEAEWLQTGSGESGLGPEPDAEFSYRKAGRVEMDTKQKRRTGR